jgi:hypothetical protein
MKHGSVSIIDPNQSALSMINNGTSNKRYQNFNPATSPEYYQFLEKFKNQDRMVTAQTNPIVNTQSI